jgi:ATP-dependent exoDNAse (exonuclease V) alpha subunit
MRFTYAMTVNKAQGITLKHALVDFVDIDQCRDKEQKLRYKYTAVTRATDYVTIED